MLSRKIKVKAEELGYTACGIIPAGSFTEFLTEIEKRSEMFPKTKEFYDIFRGMSTPPEGAESIVVCTQRMNKYRVPKELEPLYGKMYLYDPRVSYTQENRMNDEFTAFMKMLGLEIIEGSVPDRWAGAKAGIGKFGRNNFLYDKDNGSYVFIQTWIVDKKLDYDETPDNIVLTECNDGCHKCIEACPTKALSGELLMDAGKCICRVQFDEDDALSEDLIEDMGVWLYGCDACQDVCPANRNKFTETDEYPLLSEFEDFMKPETILTMNEETYKNVLHPRFWYAGEDNLWLWKCNALRVMINSGDSKYNTLIKQSITNKDKRVSEMAKWGCEKLGI
ncbi:MAG: hypothetical protein FWD38_04930 [Oscillospiraceae bacterium]|nr:hypothetical protein [Oscillospiraceae bacterium]